MTSGYLTKKIWLYPVVPVFGVLLLFFRKEVVFGFSGGFFISFLTSVLLFYTGHRFFVEKRLSQYQWYSSIISRILITVLGIYFAFLLRKYLNFYGFLFGLAWLYIAVFFTEVVLLFKK